MATNYTPRTGEYVFRADRKKQIQEAAEERKERIAYYVSIGEAWRLGDDDPALAPPPPRMATATMWSNEKLDYYKVNTSIRVKSRRAVEGGDDDLDDDEHQIVEADQYEEVQGDIEQQHREDLQRSIEEASPREDLPDPEVSTPSNLPEED